ncbi:MAG: right-handed parallel beta-helix repeat-containing protein [Clostridia bacterium]|nr:right-handed parallel beta-helix repeat-containing protein [Clostridia bacterium]
MKKIISLFLVLLISLITLTACDSIIKTPTNSGIESTTSNVESTTTNNISKDNTSEDIPSQEINNSSPAQEEEKYTEVKVSSAKDLFQNVKPFTKIILTEDYYNISDIDPTTFENDNIKVEDWYDGYEFIIRNIDHLEICSANNVMPEIVTEGAHVNVISLNNCKNVKISGLVVGHEVEKGSCSGGVIQIENSSDIEIDHCHLYGCGTYGIISRETNNVVINNTDIYGCSYGILDLSNSNHFVFNNCIFRDNGEYTMFAIHKCKDTLFNNCTITSNRSDYVSSLISASESSNITFTQCLFEGNKYDYFSSTEDDVRLNGCVIKDENSENKYYIDYAD